VKIMSAVPTSPIDSFEASTIPFDKPKPVFIRAVLPNQKENNLVGDESEREVKQGLGRVIAKIYGYRDQTQRRKFIEIYQKMLALHGTGGQNVGQNLDRHV